MFKDIIHYFHSSSEIICLLPIRPASIVVAVGAAATVIIAVIVTAAVAAAAATAAAAVAVIVTPANRSRQTKAVRKIPSSSRPIAEHAYNPDIIRQDIKYLVQLPIIADRLRERAIVVVLGRLDTVKRTRSLERPRNDIETRCLGRCSVAAGHDGVVVTVAVRQQVVEGRRDDVQALSFQRRESCDGRGECLGCIAFLVEVDGLGPEFGELADPLEDISGQEGLRPDACGCDTLVDECVDEVSCVLLLGVCSLERHGNLSRGGLELWREVAVAWEAVYQVDEVVEGLWSGAGVVELCSEGRYAVLVVFWVCCAAVAAVHLGAERQELGLGDVGGAAECCGRGCFVRRCERGGALCCQLWSQEDVGCGVQIAERVSADELKVAGKCHVALEDTCTHPCTSFLALCGQFWDLEGAAASMANGPA